ncbi:hypothetical protein QQ045_013173 [Rhodiola kirilowii]
MKIYVVTSNAWKHSSSMKASSSWFLNSFVRILYRKNQSSCYIQISLETPQLHLYVLSNICLLCQAIRTKTPTTTGCYMVGLENSWNPMNFQKRSRNCLLVLLS